MNQASAGTIVRVAGPVVVVDGPGGVHMYDVVAVGYLQPVVKPSACPAT
jgi:vacuolar-type H+-ATPase catalytic subunit A/Vma1